VGTQPQDHLAAILCLAPSRQQEVEAVQVETSQGLMVAQAAVETVVIPAQVAQEPLDRVITEEVAPHLVHPFIAVGVVVVLAELEQAELPERVAQVPHTALLDLLCFTVAVVAVVV
jgi:hypothetical protein